MKLFICTDLEGVAGVVSFEHQAFDNGKYYEAAKKLLTGEVNAAVEGALEAGVKEVVIMDGHGPGAISYEDIHPAAKLMHGRPLGSMAVWAEIVSRFDAAAMIGQHAMAGIERGTLNHTQSSRTVEYYKLNGKIIGEIAQFALFGGAFNIPLIFLSGDDCACREAEEFVPGITTASVKEGIGRCSAISCSVPEARRRIKEGMKKALKKHAKSPVKPLVWKGPYELEKRFFTTETADWIKGERVDSRTVRLHSKNITDIIYS